MIEKVLKEKTLEFIHETLCLLDKGDTSKAISKCDEMIAYLEKYPDTKDES